MLVSCSYGGLCRKDFRTSLALALLAPREVASRYST